MNLELNGKVAVVTGGGSGVGREIAGLLCSEGAMVAVVDIIGEKAEETVKMLVGRGGKTQAYQADVIDSDSVDRLAGNVLEQLGSIDILFNNAGYGMFKSFKDSTREDWMADINVNLIGTLNCTRAFINVMIEKRYGRIINIISDAGRVGEPFMTTYSAAKAAVAGFSKALAKEVGQSGITVNCVALGTTKTPLMAPFLTPEIERKMIKNYPLGRLGLPHEPARMAVFLSSEAASWITGQVIAVNGGYSMI
jgi:NAD(P)-dependent dehydrogenase (short-subunit alcohol dehydrogenase family)